MYISLATPNELKKQLPLSELQAEHLSNARQTITNILNGNDSRLLCIVGPCSIHDITSAKEYALKLKELAEKLSERFFFVMRVYLEKPRTGVNWKGFLYDPHLNGTQNIPSGLIASRELLLELATLGVPVATEFLDMTSAYYLNDLISWGCIGARTSASQFHRQLASGLPMPVGFKNTTEGNVQIAVDGIQAAAAPHSFVGIDSDGKASIVQTKGNQEGHLILRGGESGPNYDSSSIHTAASALKEAGLPSNILVDCSHDNSGKQHKKQIEVFQSVLKQHLEGDSSIKGILLESHLFEGKQPLNKPLRYGVSITDSCLDWKATENLMQWAYDQCKNCELILQ